MRGEELTDDEAEKAPPSSGAAVLAVGVVFSLAELGDKTTLATIALVTQEGWIGSTLGGVVAAARAIGVGALLGRNFPRRPSGSPRRPPSWSSACC
ncbi:MAG: TMEM165/GDT1 family protein [Geodermatophilaceae bacterium]